jgi:formylglycine-generating enzyme required for sulfatase activity
MYQEVAVDYRDVSTAAEKVIVEKESAEKAKEGMERARHEAEGLGAVAHAPDAWHEAEAVRTKGEELAQHWEYVSAEQTYKSATALYVKATEQARETVDHLSTEKRAEQKARADEAKAKAAKAKRDADAEQAAQYAKKSYTQAKQRYADAEGTYEKRDYIAAIPLYYQAVELFQQSAEEAAKHEKLPVGLARRDGRIISTKDGAEMIQIPAGEFVMGSPPGEGNSDEHPLHRLHLNAFYIDKYEVTVGQYMKFVYETGHRTPPAWVSKYSPGVTHPIVGVSWDDAVAYAKWAGKRLPTEAEWEKAARGADGRKYPWGLGEPGGGGYKANYNPGEYGQDGHEFTAPVGSFENGKSPFGVHDLAGNAAEWCLDWYGSGYYKKSSLKNPKGPPTGSERVVRGGSWRGFAGVIRSSSRSFFRPNETQIDVGFRCVKGAR